MLYLDRLLNRNRRKKLEESLGLGLRPGDPHYRAFVGPPDDYDLVAAMTFNLITTLGLRQHHNVLDIGCGSLRVGRLLIPYLNVGKYTGIEPNKWLVDEGIRQEIGQDQILKKQPQFYFANSAKNLLFDTVFDFAIAQSIFSHCGSDLVEEWLKETSRLLKDSGALLATFLIGDQDYPDRGWVYPGCVYYKAETMSLFAQNAGLELLLLDWKHPRQKWALFSKPNFDTTWLQGRQLTWNTFLEYAPKTVTG